MSPPFDFIDPGLLLDRELELVEPALAWVDSLLAAIRHPTTQRDMPSERRITRDDLLQFLHDCPRGRNAGDPACDRVPAYHFWMRLRAHPRAITIVGGIGLRVGHTPHVERYAGHIGYHVYPPYRGHHYAERACRLLLPLARRHGLREVWITCNPDNGPSRRTCERLGATLVEVVAVPPDDSLYQRGEREKCRYRVDL